jgi:hypothetical protein
VPRTVAFAAGAAAACIALGAAVWFVSRARHAPSRADAHAFESSELVNQPAPTAQKPMDAPVRPAAMAVPSVPSDEPALMAELRRIGPTDPERAIALARQGNQRFAGSADAPERTSILIHALATRGLSSEARGEAEDMVNRYPDSHWVREIEQFTGAHRHRNARLNDAGQVEFH